MSKRAKWILVAVAMLLIIAVAAAVVLVILPYRNAASSMPVDGTLTIQQMEDESLVLSWPESSEAEYYCVEILLPAESEEEEPEVLFRDYAKDGTSYTLPKLPTAQELTLRVDSAVTYAIAGEERIRLGGTPIELTTAFHAPQITNFTWMPDPDTQTITATFDMEQGDSCRVYLVDDGGEMTLLQTLEKTTFTLSFGDDGDMPMPGYDDSYSFAFDACRRIPGLDFYGMVNCRVSVVREDLLGTDLNVTVTDEGNNVCSLTWNETKGEYYEVQVLDPAGEQWITLATVDRAGERTYTSGHMESFSQFSFRVAAMGGQEADSSGFAAVSAVEEFTTGASSIYCTIWPVKELTAYTDPQMTVADGTVETGKAYCVLAEHNGAFGVRVDGKMRYIDSNYCMINLPEYLLDLCSYDITNSYSSIYMVHEYEIPEVTDVVTAGYENIKLADGSFLVPLLYPTAQKLLTAARNAISRGYKLKIYDSFRPYKATREIYDLTEKVLDDPVPETTFSGEEVKDLPKVAEGETISYRLLMTNNTWRLGSFLAKSGSRHNLGVAVDLTLENLETGKELKMQTSMHDLSWYSVLSKNNASAIVLASIMTDAGMATLSSEWWHFQDDEAKNELSLATVYSGVNAGCWMADDNGWRYRKKNGTYYIDCEKTIEGVTYTFDAEGYVLSGTE